MKDILSYLLAFAMLLLLVPLYPIVIIGDIIRGVDC